MTELDRSYQGSRGLLQGQIDTLPAQGEAEIAGLDAKLTRANTDILDASRRRGLGFSGIPVAEQAQYAATDYAPAVANVKAKQKGQITSLMEALNSLGRDQRTQAQSIYDSESARELQERSLAEQQRQFNENLAFQKAQAAAAARAAQASSGVNLGSILGGPKGTAKASAKTFVGNDDFRGHLAYLAGRGNYEAKTMLKYVGNDGIYNGKVASQDEFDILKRNGIQGSYSLARGGVTASKLLGSGGGW
jgi:hypothetical protein